jgi:molecular chaperone GrpE
MDENLTIPESPDQGASDSETFEHRPAAEEEVEACELSDVTELVQRLEQERDEATLNWKRALADFRNFQKRATDNEQRAQQFGRTAVVKAMLNGMDQFDLTLEQPRTEMTVDQLLDGVYLIREELLQALRSQGVERIDPNIGDEFDPNLHEAMMRQEQPGCPPNSIALVLQTGYTLGDIVLRPAKVAVTPGASEDGA